MDEITLKRGGREVTFRKVPDRFAVRLKQGRASSEAALAAATGRPRAEVDHVDTAAPEDLEVFSVEEADELEQMQQVNRMVSALKARALASLDNA